MRKGFRLDTPASHLLDVIVAHGRCCMHGRFYVSGFQQPALLGGRWWPREKRFRRPEAQKSFV
jgi:hypothetical protein